MSDALTVTVQTKEEAHQAALHGYALAQALIADGKPVKFHVAEDEDDLTVKQRAFLHAAVFPQIAEQVVFPDGSRYVAKLWKEHFRERFLPDKWELRKSIKWDAEQGRMVQAKRKTPHRVRQSTEDLGKGAYSAYIDLVIDTAVLELGVVFVFKPGEREAVRYVAKPRKAKQQQPEAVPA